MTRKYYALFTCDEWKSSNSMDLMGVFGRNELTKVLKREIKNKVFQYDSYLDELGEKIIYDINSLLVYGYIKELSINEIIS